MKLRSKARMAFDNLQHQYSHLLILQPSLPQDRQHPAGVKSSVVHDPIYDRAVAVEARLLQAVRVG